MLLIKNCNIIDPFSNNEIFDHDILINDNGIITKVDINITNKNYKLVYLPKNINVIPSFIDTHVHFRSPGYEYKETMETGINAAIKGGYATVIGMANTYPICDNINTINYILNKSKKINDFFLYLQVGSVTKNLLGKELTDFNNMIKNGAVGFSDDGNSIRNINICYKAMLESKKYNVPLSLHEECKDFIFNSGINFNNKTFGAMNISEYALVNRDIELAKITGAKINFQHISTKESIDLIRKAKKEYSNIYCEVTPHHISFDESYLKNFNTNFKCNPPLRSFNDKKALINGIIDKTIDIIATDHAPHSLDEKNKNFFDAPSGIIGLETSFSVCNTFLVMKNLISKLNLLRMMTTNPAKLYNIENEFGILPGKKARMTFIDFNKEVIYPKFYSKSSNSPYINMKLYGKIYGMILGNKVFWN